MIHAGKLLAVPGEATLLEQTIVVKGNRIAEVVAGYRTPASDERLLDLSDQFVMPGMMDMHVHLLGELSPNSVSQRLKDSTTMTAMHGVANARKNLHAGFTTVRDLGGHPESIFAVRDAVKAGLIPGPRIHAAGSALAATGGHGDVDGIRPDLMKLWTPSSICDGAVDCRRATRDAIKEKVFAATAQSKKSFESALKGGVRIAFGTDTGVTPHGNNAIELELMVAAGMSPMAALRSATVVTAELLEVSDQLGTIEAGKLADIISVDGDPLTDIKTMQDVKTVISDGRVEKQ